MPRNYRWIMALGIMASLQLAACAQGSGTGEKIQPARVEPIAGTSLSHVTLTAKAAERLGIETVAVHEEQVARQRTVGGEVVALPVEKGASSSKISVRVLLTASDLDKVDRRQPALIQLFDREGEEEDDDEDFDLTAELDEGPFDDLEEAGGALLYALGGARHNLVPGQIVRVRVPLQGSGVLRKIVPYSAVLYDLDGTTWVYTNPEPLVYVRHQISIDYIEGELAVLLEGPAIGTSVVIAGVAELFGAETGVGK